MKCKRVKELLLTDYIDNEMDIVLRLALDNHVKTCAACRDYKINIDRGLSPLFRDAKVQPPQEEMWQKIKSSITDNAPEAKSRVFVVNPFVRKGIFAFATAAVLLFMVIIFQNAGNNHRAGVNSFLSEEASFLYSLSANENQDVFNGADFGTDIEEWFL